MPPSDKVPDFQTGGLTVGHEPPAGACLLTSPEAPMTGSITSASVQDGSPGFGRGQGQLQVDRRILHAGDPKERWCRL
ncbi:MAG: hypothetical protein JW892_12840 [Anaerolineae bacterium]|nr:hypothetical protein [Anaerolineae bacterium]